MASLNFVQRSLMRRDFCNGETTDLGTSTHALMETYPVGEGDAPTTGTTKSFGGKETETLEYRHGTKVKVEKEGTTVTVSITYPDGTTDSLTVSAP